MKRGLWITLLAALAFAVIFLVRMPAAWLIPAGGERDPCAGVEGSLWSGACTGLRIGHVPAGDVSWRFRPWRLLAGQLGAHLTVTRGAATLNGDAELGLGGRVTIRHLLGELPLDPAIIPGLPATLSGRAQLDLTLLRLEHGRIAELAGNIEVRSLEDHSGRSTPLGSYVVSFPGGSGEPSGKFRDLEGPLAVEGMLRLTPQPGYEVEGLVAPRAGAPPELINNIRYLGSPDAAGRRQFSVAGTF